ncbi:MAG: hypothetical protein HYR50_03875 [Candidatus Rokubacteria bacterium]|nr:hypothetical protein [Candidatus Rokubacteria bacterium]
MDPLTYRSAGVDIGAGDEAVRRMRHLTASTKRPEDLGGIGAFASFVSVLADRHDTVGIDLVAMGVNDVLVHGAEPLYFLDYLAVHRVDPARVEAIVSGVAEGCRRAGCPLVGGETAEMNELYAPLVVRPGDAARAAQALSAAGERVFDVGVIRAGARSVVYA